MLERQIMPLFKARCVKCHGPAVRKGRLNLATPRGLARGGESGAIVEAGHTEESILWDKVSSGEMPPKEPMAESEKQLIRRWIEHGAPGLTPVSPGDPEGADHWAFAPASRPAAPQVGDGRPVRTPIDCFIEAALEQKGLKLGQDADRPTLVRRVSFDLTGLPPSPEDVERFRNDRAPGAYERMVERFLASPHYGERWGKYWLDAAGYADSNGYFDADTDRPLAYRYRDYVIRSWNQDKPLDRFIQEQIAGDEIAGFHPGARVTPELIDLLVATHFLRNAPDGTGESDGNPDELRADRYAVLEGTTQVLGSALLGLTLQCARCHDHKFEPVTQKDYYQLYAILWPSYDIEHWVKPQDRIAQAPLPEALAAWEARCAQLDAHIAELRADFASWADENREHGAVRFRDEFDGGEPLAARWSHSVPGDDSPAGSPPVRVDSDAKPGARVRDGRLQIAESSAPGSRCLATRQSFDWTPDAVGGWIEASFELVDTKLAREGAPAERVGYYIALRDYNDTGDARGGNILFDGNPRGGAEVHVDYPGKDAQARGTIGSAGYAPGRRYGVRITNIGAGKYLAEHIVDWIAEGKTLILSAADLPDGGFGFEFCCGRSFVVDSLRIESRTAPCDGWHSALFRAPFVEASTALREARDAAIKSIDATRPERPGKIAWLSDLSSNPSETHILGRGVYNSPGAKVAAAPPSVLADATNPFEVQPAASRAMTGRRLAFARWLTQPGSRPAALLARVLANRIWQHHFGTGLVPTPENLGYSGTPPSHPELLEWLASELAAGRWRAKRLHRLILNSSVYRQSSARSSAARAHDPDNQLLGSFPVRRLDAEAIRDGMLAASGELDRRMGGPYVPTQRAGDGEVTVPEDGIGTARRSVYLQQRRTQVLSVLDVFDSPSIVTNCTRRNSSTMPLQSLSLLNSGFMTARARGLARLLKTLPPDVDQKIRCAFERATGRAPCTAEQAAARRFLERQPAVYAGRPDSSDQAWTDFCQMLLASHAYLYQE
jgi:hypothetical protein